MRCKPCFILLFLLITVINCRANGHAFIENKGQIKDQSGKPNPSVHFLYSSPDFNIQLRRTGFSYEFLQPIDQPAPIALDPYETSPANRKMASHRIDVDFEGSRTEVQIIREEIQPGYLNYLGARQVSSVYSYSQVRYVNVYPFIDIVFHAGAEGFKYDFILHPGADPSLIRMKYSGASAVYIDADQLIVAYNDRELIEKIPESYFKNSGRKVQVQYQVTANSIVSFTVPVTANLHDDLIIDPLPCLNWCSYFGGAAYDISNQIVFHNNSFFVAGAVSSSNDIASTGSFDTIFSGFYDGYVGRFSADGTTRIWCTYFGGTDADAIECLIPDEQGNIYAVGSFASAGLATPGALQVSYGGGLRDALILKLSSDGTSCEWATYFGSSGNDLGKAITFSTDSNLIISGDSQSSNLLYNMTGYDTYHSGGVDGFLIKLSRNGDSLFWGTFIGDSGDDRCYDVGTLPNGNLVVCGSTHGLNSLITSSAFQPSYGGGGFDGFILTINAGGDTIQGCSHFGGTGSDHFESLVVADDSSVYLCGRTESIGLATPGSFQSNYGGSISDGIIAKVKSDCSALYWCTYYGGASSDWLFGITADSMSNIFVTGISASLNGIATPGTVQQTFGGGSADAIVAMINSSGTILQWGTYYGGLYDDYGFSIIADLNGNVYITGYTYSLNIPCNGSYYDTTFGGVTDALMFSLGCTGVSVEEFIAGKSHLIYPNPALDFLNLAGCNVCSITIRDIAGRVCIEKEFAEVTDQEKMIPVNKLTPGIYFIEIEEQRTSVQLKFIKL